MPALPHHCDSAEGMGRLQGRLVVAIDAFDGVEQEPVISLTLPLSAGLSDGNAIRNALRQCSSVRRLVGTRTADVGQLEGRELLAADHEIIILSLNRTENNIALIARKISHIRHSTKILQR